VSQSAALVSYPIPIQKRHAGSGFSPAEKKMRMGVPATAAAGTAVVASSIGAVVPSVITASKSENAVSVLNQYRHGLNYHVVSQVGPAHAPVFTVQVEVDGQVCKLCIYPGIVSYGQLPAGSLIMFIGLSYKFATLIKLFYQFICSSAS